MSEEQLFRLTALSPLDGRYRDKVEALAPYFSEWALNRYRLLVEVEWLIFLAERPSLDEIRPLTAAETEGLRDLVEQFGPQQAAEVKAIEARTRHDVKAVEYYLKQQLAGSSLEELAEFVHFCCTSEDINNLAYALMLKAALQEVWLPQARQLVQAIVELVQETRTVPMLARTHGQAASPTTMGKELAVFVYRWRRQLAAIEELEFLAKFSGATGNFNAHVAAYPAVDWLAISRGFVSRLGLTHNPLTTQIESHDYLAECFQALVRFNNVTLDFDRDIWHYISLGYFNQSTSGDEVGSSTMPHKVNPIRFENSEANLGLSNQLLNHLASKLAVSRLQRDLSDSSALRNVGTALGYATLALRSALAGVAQLQANPARMEADLDEQWAVLAEAIQTVMRKLGMEHPYETLKAFSRGRALTEQQVKDFIGQLDLPQRERDQLLAMTPSSYTGLAAQLASLVLDEEQNERR